VRAAWVSSIARGMKAGARRRPEGAAPGPARRRGSRARFREEALALSQLNHPHIRTIYEVGEADGRAYIAMEYVEGRPLSGLVPHDGLPIETVIRYGAQIAEALAHAHDHGLAHRDLKSSNVMITPEGRAKVLDFGLARRLREAEAGDVTRSKGTLTEAGSVAGTLHYMAPEVLQGEPADAQRSVGAGRDALRNGRRRAAVPGTDWFRGQLRQPQGAARPAAAARAGWAPRHHPAPSRQGTRPRYQRAGEVRAALEAVQSGTAIAPPPRLQRARWPPCRGPACGAGDWVGHVDRASSRPSRPHRVDRRAAARQSLGRPSAGLLRRRHDCEFLFCSDFGIKLRNFSSKSLCS
jgi:hypothetical protein